MRLLETSDVGAELGTMALHGLSMPLGVVVLAVGERRFGHERPKPCVVGRLDEVEELLLGDAQVFPQLPKAAGDLREAALDERPGHRGSVGPGREAALIGHATMKG